ncbi:MAG TPA: VWA domain-containing protein [Thermoanaerobaculia bacterium]|nr:VWA domain-containing protein [Thermoanaerobaculia bacterium]
MKTRISLFFLFLTLLPFALLRAQGLQENDPTLWPEPERAFFQDGPGLLMTAEQRTELRGFNPEARAHWIQQFLDFDPNPRTPVNELREGIARRQRLANDEYLSTQDARWQLLFLHGKPDDRLQIDCGTAFKPLEIWSYPAGTGPDGKPLMRQLVLYAPERGVPFHLWVPVDSKRVLFTPQMEYWLQQWEELHGRIGAERFDLQVCKEAKKIDEATGVPGLTGVGSRKSKFHPIDNSSWLAAPKELAAWAREAAATEIPDAAPALKVAAADLHFPDSDGQRIVARALVRLPPDSGVKPSADATPYVRLIVEGMVEQQDKQFEDFRMRFQLPAPKPDEPVVLAIDRALRPKESFVLRLHIKDEVGGGETWVSRGFRVPMEPVPEAAPAVAVAAQGELVPRKTAAGADSLLLLPPTADVLIGLWRAEALVTGERIQKVTFLVDGKTQLTTSKKPFSAEVRLSSFPTEQTVRAEGYDAEGKLVAADNVIVNQPKGAFNVRIVSPAKGARPEGSRTLAKAEVFVPEGRVLRSMEFRVNDQLIASLTKPPWQTEVPIPAGDLVYLTAVATLDDGSHVEALRYLRAPENVSEVDVDLVELYTAVTDRSGNLVNDLKQEDFEVYESGKKQELVKFDAVRNLPLTVCMLIDTSGSMASSLASAQQAATGFLQSVMRPGDKAFAVSFARRPRLEIAPTDDVGAVVQAISGLQAVGDTALHDALVHSLYYFRGVKGQRALVLLSDGDDNSSYITYKEAKEYASRSGVAVYAIGLNLTFFDTGIKAKLGELATSSGGRAFFTNDPKELPAIYKQIEAELRNRYLLAYNSTEAGTQTGYRPVEVKVKKSGLKARTEKGYYP